MKIVSLSQLLMDGIIKMTPEDLIEKLESTANFMRGMRFDPRLHHEIRDAITERVAEIDLFIEQYMDDLLK